MKILSRMMLHLADKHNVSLILLPTYFRQLKTYRDKGRRIYGCALYGGEPFLASHIDTVRNICEHCRELDVPINAVTNGYDLDAYLDLLDEFKFTSLQITLDGKGAMHDRRRPVVGGGSSYARIIANIEEAIKREIKVYLRVNVDRQNIDDLSVLIDDFNARGFRDNPYCLYYFRAVEPNTSPNPALELNDIDVFEKLRELGLDEREAIERDSIFVVCGRNVLRALEKKKYPELNARYCGAESGMFVIDAAGDICSCWGLVGDERHVIGKVDVPGGRFDLNFDMVKWRTRRVHNLENCRECPYVMQCGGGCAQLAYRQCGTIRIGFCDVFREAFDHVLQFGCREAWSAARSTELSKSWREILSRIDESDRRTLLKTTAPKQTLDIWKKAATLKEIFGDAGVIAQ